MPFADEPSSTTLLPPTMTTVSSGCYGPNSSVPYIDLNWNPSPSANVVLYHVYRSKDNPDGSKTPFVYVGSANGSQTTFRDTPQFGLENKTTYTYQMTAEQFSNQGPTSQDYSNQVRPTSPDCSTSTPTPTPTSQSTPTPTTLVPPTITSVASRCEGASPVMQFNVTHPAPNTLISYSLLRADVNSSSFIQVGDPRPIAPSVFDFNAQNNTTYNYAIAAIDANHKISDYSNRVRPTSPQCVPPSPTPSSTPTTLVAPPTMTTVTLGCNGSNKPYVDLNWSPSTTPGVAWYHVYRKPSGGEYKYIGSANGSQTTFRDTLQFGIANYTVYSYKMQAELYSNTGPSSDFSNQMDFSSLNCF